MKALLLAAAALAIGACYADDVRLGTDACGYAQAPIDACDPYYEWLPSYYVHGVYVRGYYRLRGPHERGYVHVYGNPRPVHAPRHRR